MDKEILFNFYKYLRDKAEDLPKPQTFTTQTARTQGDMPYATRIQVADTDYMLMLMTQEAYKKPSQRAKNIGLAVYNAGLSTDRIAVYESGSGAFKVGFIGIHGTKPSSIEDLSQDYRIITGEIGQQGFTIAYVTQILRTIQQWKSQGVQNDEIFIGGHSLGGYYSLLASYVGKVEGRGFNPAINPFSLGSDLGFFKTSVTSLYAYPKYRAFIMERDVIAQPATRALPKDHIFELKTNPPPNGALEAHSLEFMIQHSKPALPLLNPF